MPHIWQLYRQIWESLVIHEMVFSMNPSRRTLYASISVAFFLCPYLFAQSKPETSKVPFVGCESDGQVGPLDKPTGKSVSEPLVPEVAQQLAYYKTEQGPGVLAPRGWHCFGTYGSNGSSLYVTPDPIGSALLFSSTWKGFSGSAVQLSFEYGGTSGRFGVAETIARVFPAYQTFVSNVVDEDTQAGIKPPVSFTFGPYPNDTLIYKSKTIVEFQTPPNTEGLGSHSRLLANYSSIKGVAILLVPPADPDTDLLKLFTRLPANMAQLTTIIVQQVERDSTKISQ